MLAFSIAIGCLVNIIRIGDIVAHNQLLHFSIGDGKGGGARLPHSAEGGLAPLRMISCRNYPSWSGAENRDKDRYTPVECSNTLIEQSRPS